MVSASRLRASCAGRKECRVEGARDVRELDFAPDWTVTASEARTGAAPMLGTESVLALAEVGTASEEIDNAVADPIAKLEAFPPGWVG